MNQDQFNRLLAWTILSTLNSSQLLLQSQLGRELNQVELTKCHKDAYAQADLIYGMLAENCK